MSLVILASALTGILCGSIGFAIGVWSTRWAAEAKLIERRKTWAEYYSSNEDAEFRAVVCELTKPL